MKEEYTLTEEYKERMIDIRRVEQAKRRKLDMKEERRRNKKRVKKEVYE